jgi:hypothetical protein
MSVSDNPETLLFDLCPRMMGTLLAGLSVAKESTKQNHSVVVSSC